MRQEEIDFEDVLYPEIEPLEEADFFENTLEDDEEYEDE